MLTSRGLGRVLGDLAAMGFDARWGVLGAADVGANHQRDRIWIVGKATNTTIDGLSRQANQQIMESQRGGEFQFVKSRDSSEMDNYEISNANSTQCQGVQQPKRTEQEYAYACNSRWWQAEPDVGRMVDGMASGAHRLKAIGNGQVPLCAATAWRILNDL